MHREDGVGAYDRLLYAEGVQVHDMISSKPVRRRAMLSATRIIGSSGAVTEHRNPRRGGIRLPRASQGGNCRAVRKAMRRSADGLPIRDGKVTSGAGLRADGDRTVASRTPTGAGLLTPADQLARARQAQKALKSPRRGRCVIST